MNLKDYLQKQKISISKAAKQIGIHRNHLDACIRGTRRPSVELAHTIMEYCEHQISLDELLPCRTARMKCPTCDKALSSEKYNELFNSNKKSVYVKQLYKVSDAQKNP